MRSAKPSVTISRSTAPSRALPCDLPRTERTMMARKKDKKAQKAKKAQAAEAAQAAAAQSAGQAPKTGH